MVNREELYRKLFTEVADRSGVLKLSQRAISAEIGISYQALSEIFTEWIRMGRMKKYAYDFQIFNPDKYDWSSAEYKAERKAARNTPQVRKTRKSTKQKS